MNNYFPQVEEEKIESPILRGQEQELLKVIEAITALMENKDWRTLKEIVFDRAVESLERLLEIEAKKKEVNSGELYRLQGQIAWAKTYADLGKYGETLKQRLIAIRKKLNEPN